MSPNSAKIEVPEKCEIPGMDVIGELACLENSSIFLSISSNCLLISSICSIRCLICITSDIESMPIESLAACLSLSAVKEIRLPCLLKLKHFLKLLISALAILAALVNVFRILL